MKLYHYTDLNGLKGIVENKSLWATSLQFLNDSEELLHGMECIKNALPKFEEKIPSPDIESIIHALERYSKRYLKNAYNISFCRDPELLSQWRGYANKQGVCLEFDRDELLTSLDLECCKYEHDDVIYCAKGASANAESQLRELFDSLALAHKSNHFEDYKKLNAIQYASRAIPFFKNIAFSEEKEYRIVVYPFHGLHEVKFRVSEQGLIPYVELAAKEKTIGENNKVRFGKIPISKVIVAPSDLPPGLDTTLT